MMWFGRTFRFSYLISLVVFLFEEWAEECTLNADILQLHGVERSTISAKDIGELGVWFYGCDSWEVAMFADLTISHRFRTANDRLH